METSRKNKQLHRPLRFQLGYKTKKNVVSSARFYANFVNVDIYTSMARMGTLRFVIIVQTKNMLKVTRS